MMNKQMLVGGVTAAILSVALMGCGSESKDSASSSATTSSSEAETTTEESTEATTAAAAPAGEAYTIAQYIVDEGIVETTVADGDPGAPVIGLQVPEGWEPMAPEDLPENTYGAIMYPGTTVPDNPPRFLAILSKLTGPVDPAKIIEYAPGEVLNLNGYESLGEGQESTLGGYAAYQMAAIYVDEDAMRTVFTEKTVVIPSPDGDGLFVLQLAGFSGEEELEILMNATTQIDEQTTITF